MIRTFLKVYGLILCAEILHIFFSVVGQYTSCEIICEPFSLNGRVHVLLVVIALVIAMITKPETTMLQ